MLNKADKIIDSYRVRGRSLSSRNTNLLYRQKSDDDIKNTVELKNADVSKYFEKERFVVAKSLKKKIVLHHLTTNFKDIMKKNFEAHKQFKCSESPKLNYMTELHKTSELINKIGTCKLKSRFCDFSS